MSKVVGYLSLLSAVCLVASCSSAGSSHSASTTPRSSSAPQSITPKPTVFTSKAYGYTLTVPAGWTTTQAFDKWDGESELDGTSASADLLGQPGETSGVFAVAAPSTRDLAADTAYAITWNDHYHGDYCPPQPTTRSRITVGGQPGVLLAYNCGILVNTAVTVYHGVEYWFSFIDHGVASATDPHDRATFMTMLSSVHLRG